MATSLPSPSDVGVDSLPTSNFKGSDNKEERHLPVLSTSMPPILGLAVLSAAFVPVAFLPYFFARRRLIRLASTLDAMRSSVVAQRHELRTVVSEARSQHEQYTRLFRDYESLKGRVQEIHSDVLSERAKREETSSAIQTRLQSLDHQTKELKSAFLDCIKTSC